MSYSNDDDIRGTRAKLAQSRAEILSILEPQPGEEPSDGTLGGGGGGFPRSRTMKLLLSGRGMGTVGAVLGGLVIARPTLAFRLIRMLPAGAVARMLLVKAVSSLRIGAKRRPAGRRGTAPDQLSTDAHPAPPGAGSTTPS